MMLTRSESIDPARIRTSLRERLRASGIHLACCIGIASLVLAVVFWAWYPPPLDRLSGLEAILIIMLGADVALGPLVTLVIYDRSKKHLKLDLAIVILVQASALAYGLYTVFEGRPAHLVFVKDRFEVIAPADITAQDRSAARGNPSAAASPLGPKWVAAKPPSDIKERQALLFEALDHGRDLQHYPRLYEPYASHAQAAAARGLPLDQLRRLNRDKAAEIDALPKALGVAPEMLRYLPIKGPATDAAVIIRADTGEVMRIVPLQPW